MDRNKIAETIEGWAEELMNEEQKIVSDGGVDISVAHEGQNAKFQENWPTGVWEKRLAAEMLRMAKLLTAGCEKLPDGPMRENCEKRKEEGKKKESSRRRLTAGRDVRVFVTVPVKNSRNVESELEFYVESLVESGEIGSYEMGSPKTEISLVLDDVSDLGLVKSEVGKIAGRYRGTVIYS